MDFNFTQYVQVAIETLLIQIISFDKLYFKFVKDNYKIIFLAWPDLLDLMSNRMKNCLLKIYSR